MGLGDHKQGPNPAPHASLNVPQPFISGPKAPSLTQAHKIILIPPKQSSCPAIRATRIPANSHRALIYARHDLRVVLYEL